MEFRIALAAAILVMLPLGIAAQQYVPFVGCPSDGQTGPVDPRTQKGPSRRIRTETASLAYYRGTLPFGVLAPRGWHCFGMYGSSGDVLLIAPWIIDDEAAFTLSDNPRKGPMIVVSRYNGDTSGRFMVAELIKRLFPAYRKIATDIYSLFPELERSNSSGPYPAEKLVYKSKRIVEFRTPPGTKGIGTQVWLRADENPIQGVALLTPYDGIANATVLSVRLSPDLGHLAPTIIHQMEHDAGN